MKKFFLVFLLLILFIIYVNNSKKIKGGNNTLTLFKSLENTYTKITHINNIFNNLNNNFNYDNFQIEFQVNIYTNSKYIKDLEGGIITLGGNKNNTHNFTMSVSNKTLQIGCIHYINNILIDISRLKYKKVLFKLRYIAPYVTLYIKGFDDNDNIKTEGYIDKLGGLSSNKNDNNKFLIYLIPFKSNWLSLGTNDDIDINLKHAQSTGILSNNRLKCSISNIYIKEGFKDNNISTKYIQSYATDMDLTNKNILIEDSQKYDSNVVDYIIFGNEDNLIYNLYTDSEQNIYFILKNQNDVLSEKKLDKNLFSNEKFNQDLSIAILKFKENMGNEEDIYMLMVHINNTFCFFEKLNNFNISTIESLEGGDLNIQTYNINPYNPNQTILYNKPYPKLFSISNDIVKIKISDTFLSYDNTTGVVSEELNGYSENTNFIIKKTNDFNYDLYRKNNETTETTETKLIQIELKPIELVNNIYYKYDMIYIDKNNKINTWSNVTIKENIYNVIHDYPIISKDENKNQLRIYLDAIYQDYKLFYNQKRRTPIDRWIISTTPDIKVTNNSYIENYDINNQNIKVDGKPLQVLITDLFGFSNKRLTKRKPSDLAKDSNKNRTFDSNHITFISNKIPGLTMDLAGTNHPEYILSRGLDNAWGSTYRDKISGDNSSLNDYNIMQDSIVKFKFNRPLKITSFDFVSKAGNEESLKNKKQTWQLNGVDNTSNKYITLKNITYNHNLENFVVTDNEIIGRSIVNSTDNTATILKNNSILDNAYVAVDDTQNKFFNIIELSVNGNVTNKVPELYYKIDDNDNEVLVSGENVRTDCPEKYNNTIEDTQYEKYPELNIKTIESFVNYVNTKSDTTGYEGILSQDLLNVFTNTSNTFKNNTYHDYLIDTRKNPFNHWHYVKYSILLACNNYSKWSGGHKSLEYYSKAPNPDDFIKKLKWCYKVWIPDVTMNYKVSSVYDNTKAENIENIEKKKSLYNINPHKNKYTQGHIKWDNKNLHILNDLVYSRLFCNMKELGPPDNKFCVGILGELQKGHPLINETNCLKGYKESFKKIWGFEPPCYFQFGIHNGRWDKEHPGDHTNKKFANQLFPKSTYLASAPAKFRISSDNEFYQFIRPHSRNRYYNDIWNKNWGPKMVTGIKDKNGNLVGEKEYYPLDYFSQSPEQKGKAKSFNNLYRLKNYMAYVELRNSIGLLFHQHPVSSNWNDRGKYFYKYLNNKYRYLVWEYLYSLDAKGKANMVTEGVAYRAEIDHHGTYQFRIYSGLDTQINDKFVYGLTKKSTLKTEDQIHHILKSIHNANRQSYTSVFNNAMRDEYPIDKLFGFNTIYKSTSIHEKNVVKNTNLFITKFNDLINKISNNNLHQSKENVKEILGDNNGNMFNNKGVLQTNDIVSTKNPEYIIKNASNILEFVNGLYDLNMIIRNKCKNGWHSDTNKTRSNINPEDRFSFIDAFYYFGEGALIDFKNKQPFINLNDDTVLTNTERQIISGFKGYRDMSYINVSTNNNVKFKYHIPLLIYMWGCSIYYLKFILKVYKQFGNWGDGECNEYKFGTTEKYSNHWNGAYFIRMKGQLEKIKFDEVIKNNNDVIISYINKNKLYYVTLPFIDSLYRNNNYRNTYCTSTCFDQNCDLHNKLSDNNSISYYWTINDVEKMNNSGKVEYKCLIKNKIENNVFFSAVTSDNKRVKECAGTNLPCNINSKYLKISIIRNSINNLTDLDSSKMELSILVNFEIIDDSGNTQYLGVNKNNEIGWGNNYNKKQFIITPINCIDVDKGTVLGKTILGKTTFESYSQEATAADKKADSADKKAVAADAKAVSTANAEEDTGTNKAKTVFNNVFL